MTTEEFKEWGLRQQNHTPREVLYQALMDAAGTEAQVFLQNYIDNAARKLAKTTPRMICEYPSCPNFAARENVCLTHINTNTHRRVLGLELLHKGHSGVVGTFRVRMLSPCSYWSDGHIVKEDGACRCGNRFAVMEFEP
jgi:hypothetical protein